MLVQGRAVLPTVAAVVLHHRDLGVLTFFSVMLIEGRREMAVIPAVTAVLLHIV
jgi:hypothetical protein